ncbi:MAG: LacI family DNA-binding transcriptional regulator [Anaerolineae bacterium]|nr:LacI family DNA-binding transcriptional regulator [Anaerolineae bacterium]
MPITIRDLAKHAGVSIKTVSRVLNDEPRVSVSTRSRVVEAMQQLGYTPNISAQRLARGRAHAIGLVFHNATWDYINDVLQGTLETAHPRGYSIAIHPCDLSQPEAEQEVIQLVGQRRVDGLIFTPPSDNAPALLAALQQLDIPFVRLTPRDRGLHAPYVAADDRRGACRMTEHLVDLGHRRIGFVMGHVDHQASHDRLAGFRDALKAHDLPYDPLLVQQGNFTFESGVAAGQALLTNNPRPTAIFASNDNMAAGVLYAAHQLGIAVPTQLSIGGFDDVALARQVWPPLTTVRQPIYESAALAARLLIQLLNGELSDDPAHYLPTTLVIRESTGSIDR